MAILRRYISKNEGSKGCRLTAYFKKLINISMEAGGIPDPDERYWYIYQLFDNISSTQQETEELNKFTSQVLPMVWNAWYQGSDEPGHEPSVNHIGSVWSADAIIYEQKGYPPCDETFCLGTGRVPEQKPLKI